ncbi:DUF4097 family beta strand repeat-containing protein [Negadavirga shengliensis]|uniref:DUF4097 family beta strand repeat-containing protein n=1 Tax=Negadavirga shengliensis TaxID=1389218 RepID=A0ABV9TAJ9_9BACT
MKNKIPSTLFGMMLLFLSSAMMSVAQQDIRKTFSGIDKLEMEVGAIEVSYTGSPNTSEINLHAMLGENENTDKSLIMVTVGNTLKISYRPPSEQNRGTSKRFIELKGPESIELKIKNSSGLLAVSGVKSQQSQLTVTSGNLRAKDMSGNLQLKGTSGKVTASNITGDITFTMTSGIAEIDQIDGDVDFSSTSGMLRANNISGRLNAKLTSGTMRLDNIGELGQLSVTSGNIRAKNAGLGSGTSLQGSSGNIDITTQSQLEAFNYDIKAGSGSVRVGDQSKPKFLNIQNGAQHTIKGNIGSGSIQIKDL